MSNASRSGSYYRAGVWSPDFYPGHPDYHFGPEPAAAPARGGHGLPLPSASTDRKNARLDQFARLYAELAPRDGEDQATIKAAKQLGIGVKTAKQYKKELGLGRHPRHGKASS